MYIYHQYTYILTFISTLGDMCTDLSNDQWHIQYSLPFSVVLEPTRSTDITCKPRRCVQLHVKMCMTVLATLPKI